MAELSRCLRLTAPVGMTQEDRREWLVVALPEVEHIARCEFFDACSEARKTADHPAKIIPKICAYRAPPYLGAADFRKKLRHRRAEYENQSAPRLGHDRRHYEPDEALKAGMDALIAELAVAAGRRP